MTSSWALQSCSGATCTAATKAHESPEAGEEGYIGHPEYYLDWQRLKGCPRPAWTPLSTWSRHCMITSLLSAAYYEKVTAGLYFRQPRLEFVQTSRVFCTHACPCWSTLKCTYRESHCLFVFGWKVLRTWSAKAKSSSSSSSSSSSLGKSCFDPPIWFPSALEDPKSDMPSFCCSSRIMYSASSMAPWVCECYALDARAKKFSRMFSLTL